MRDAGFTIANTNPEDGGPKTEGAGQTRGLQDAGFKIEEAGSDDRRPNPDNEGAKTGGAQQETKDALADGEEHGKDEAGGLLSSLSRLTAGRFSA